MPTGHGWPVGFMYATLNPMKKKLLLVEDQLEVIEVLRKIVDANSWEMQVAIDMDAARAALKVREYDLVLTDFTFPGGDGNVVARIAKQLGNKKIWLHTGDVDNDHITPALFDAIYQKLDRRMMAQLKI